MKFDFKVIIFCKSYISLHVNSMFRVHHQKYTIADRLKKKHTKNYVVWWCTSKAFDCLMRGYPQLIKATFLIIKIIFQLIIIDEFGQSYLAILTQLGIKHKYLIKKLKTYKKVSIRLC